MEYVLVPLVALLASGLTLFSGFGLGTLLLPAFAIFFPIDAAVAMTAVVHLLNNLFKLVLLGRHADRGVILRFGLPAILAALAGAGLLARLGELPPLATHDLGEVTWVKLVIGTLMVVFALVELRSGKGGRGFDRRYLPVGGLVSGFFGGLSGHQGAMRSAFLIRAGLSKEAFIATGVVIACLIDVSRLSVYAAHFMARLREHHPAGGGDPRRLHRRLRRQPPDAQGHAAHGADGGGGHARGDRRRPGGRRRVTTTSPPDSPASPAPPPTSPAPCPRATARPSRWRAPAA